MAEEIQVPIRLYPQRTNNANACWDQLTQSTDAHQPAGFRFRNTEIAEVNGDLTRPIPSSVNGTPAGKVRLSWVSASADTDNCKWFVYVKDIAYDTDTTDPASWDDSLTVVDASNGQYVENQCDVSISTATLSSGRNVRFLIKRDSTDGSDTLAADVILTGAIFVADE